MRSTLSQAFVVPSRLVAFLKAREDRRTRIDISGRLANRKGILSGRFCWLGGCRGIPFLRGGFGEGSKIIGFSWSLLLTLEKWGQYSKMLGSLTHFLRVRETPGSKGGPWVSARCTLELVDSLESIELAQWSFSVAHASFCL